MAFSKSRPQCSDVINNDPGQDGNIDFDGGLFALGYVATDPDTKCDSASDINEKCGLGFELAFVLPGLMWLRRRRRRLH